MRDYQGVGLDQFLVSTPQGILLSFFPPSKKLQIQDCPTARMNSRSSSTTATTWPWNCCGYNRPSTAEKRLGTNLEFFLNGLMVGIGERPPAMPAWYSICSLPTVSNSQTNTEIPRGQTRQKPSVCPEHGEQVCEKAWSQPSPLLEDQIFRDRINGELDYDSCQRSKSQCYKTPESLTTAVKTTVGAKDEERCYRRAGPQLPIPSPHQAGGDRFTKVPDHGG